MVVHTAFADSIPLICITGQVNSELLGSDVFQEADITGAVESFVKYSYLIKDVDEIPKVFKEAFYIANSGRKGPVLIDIPIVSLQSMDKEQVKQIENIIEENSVDIHDMPEDLDLSESESEGTEEPTNKAKFDW